MLYGFQG